MRPKTNHALEYPQNSTKLIPLRNKFQQTYIKEVPGWRQPAPTPNSMKLTSVKPYKVKNRRDFYSPLSFATDQRLPLILQPRSSKSLPRLAKNIKTHFEALKNITDAYSPTSDALEHKSKSSVSMMDPDGQDSDTDSNPMQALYSYKNLDPPENPKIKFLTAKSALNQQSEYHNIVKVKSVNNEEKKLKDDNQDLKDDRIRGYGAEWDEKSQSEEIKEKLRFLALGKKINFARLKRTQSLKVIIQRIKVKNSRPGSCKTQRRRELSSDENPELEIKEIRAVLSTAPTKMNTKEGFPSPINQKIYNSNIPEVFPENPDSDQEGKVYTKKSKVNKKVRIKESDSSEIDSDSDSEDKTEEKNKQNIERDLKHQKGSGKIKILEKILKKSEKIDTASEKNDFLSPNCKTHLIESDLDKSESFSPRIKKILQFSDTNTPQKIPSSSVLYTPSIKSPDLINSNSNPLNFSKTKHPGFLQIPKKPTNPEKSFKKTKTAHQKFTPQSPKSPLLSSIKSLKSSKFSKPSLKSPTPKPSSPTFPLFSLNSLTDSQENPNLLNVSQHSPDSENSKKIRTSKSLSKNLRKSPTKVLRSMSKKQTQKTFVSSRESPVANDKKLEIRIIQAPDLSKESNKSYKTESVHYGLLEENDFDNQSHFSTPNGYLDVSKKTKKGTAGQKSWLSGRERAKPEIKPESFVKPNRRSSKAEFINKSTLRSKKNPSKTEGLDLSKSSSSSNESVGSSFSKYSLIRQVELEQNYKNKSGKQIPASIKFLTSFISSEIEKKLKKLNPVDNFVINFSFSLLKSIRNLIKIQNLIGVSKPRKSKNFLRAQTKLFDKASLDKVKALVQKPTIQTKPQTLKAQNLKPPKTQKTFKATVTMKNSKDPTGKLTPTRQSSKENPKYSKTIKKSPNCVQESDSSSSSLIKPSSSERSKKSLLYELSHQELVLQLAQQIVNTKSSDQDSNSISSSDSEKSSKSSLNDFELQNEFGELAQSLKTLPKNFAFGPDLRLSLLKQNQINFDFKELEKGNYEIDHEGLKRFSKKQEFLGLTPKIKDPVLTPYTLQVKPYDNLSEEQQYRYRIQKVKILNKKREKFNERFKSLSPHLENNSKNSLKQGLNSIGRDFEERVYLRLRGPHFPVYPATTR